MKKNNPDDLAKLLAESAAENHADDVVVIDMRGVATYTDYFVLATGKNRRLTQTIAEKVVDEMKDQGFGKPRRRESDQDGNWLLLDFVDVVLHIFTPDARQFYRLESLWGQMPQWNVVDSHERSRESSDAAAG